MTRPVVHVEEETGNPIIWGCTFWLPPTEGHGHPVFLNGYSQGQVRENAVAPNGMTIRQNIIHKAHRFHAAGVPVHLRRGHFPTTCGCIPCTRLADLASATLALHEGRMGAYASILDRLR